MKTDFVSRPVQVKAIQFVGTNWDEVIKMIELNGGEARMVYLDQHGQPTQSITSHKMLVFKGVGASPTFQAHGDQKPFIVLNGDQGSMFPYGEAEFLAFHLDDPSLISNGQHTFHDLYKEISKCNPTLEEILVTDKVSLYREHEAVQIFIKQTAIHHVDSAHKSYYVINGTVYV